MATATGNPPARAKRVREVWDNSMVAHIWANQSQDHARNKQNNFYFSGPSIFSYGSHFEIARHVSKGKRRAILFTTRTYSNTTAVHISTVRRAIRGTDPVFHVPTIGESKADIAANWQSYMSRARDLQLRAERARKNGEWYLGILSNLIAEANAYADFYGMRVKRIPTDLEEASKSVADSLNRLTAKERAEQARRRRAHEKRQAELAEQAKERLDQWVAGDKVRTWDFHCLPCRLRINGDTIETSHGAEFPLEHGIKAFPAILANREKAAEWVRNGHQIRLGHFGIDRIDPDGTVHAGCHVVAWDEIERIARQLGLIS